MLFFDITFFLAGWLVGQLLFAGYEAHVPWTKRLSKLVVLTLIFLLLHVFVGRWAFYTLLIGMSVGMSVLHGYWFQYRNGIHWRTAQPREKYLQLMMMHMSFRRTAFCEEKSLPGTPDFSSKPPSSK